jgi:hypothetical protein
MLLLKSRGVLNTKVRSDSKERREERRCLKRVDRVRGKAERHPNTLHDGDCLFQFEKRGRNKIQSERTDGIGSTRFHHTKHGFVGRHLWFGLDLQPASGLLRHSNLYFPSFSNVSFGFGVGMFRTRSICLAIDSSCLLNIYAEGRVEVVWALEPVLATKVKVGAIVVNVEVLRTVQRAKSIE